MRCLPVCTIRRSSGNNSTMRINPFNLEFASDKNGRPFFASFPFIMDGVPVSGISCGISSRYAGNMKYDKESLTRRGLFSYLGLEPSRVYGLWQIHSQTVLIVDSQNPPALSAGPESPPKADGMVSNDRAISLSVTAADCLPVYLLDTESGAAGLVHSGWKGTGIVLEALRLMKENWRTRPETVAAVLGPCIDVCCYRVNAERALAFKKDFGADCVRNPSEGEYFLDLKAANVKLLSNAGVRNIAVCGECTFTDERLGSFRREGKENFTLMAAMVYSG